MTADQIIAAWAAAYEAAHGFPPRPPMVFSRGWYSTGLSKYRRADVEQMTSNLRARSAEKAAAPVAPAMTPPSAKDYAASVVAAKYVGRRQRLALLPHELAALVSTAYDAGVLAQQRFAERKP